MISTLNDREKLFQYERLDLIMKTYNQAFIIIMINTSDLTKKLSIRKIAAFYNIVHIILFKCINDQISSYQQAHEKKQRLSHIKKEALMSWIRLISKWDWPSRVNLVRHMIYEMLIKKEDHRPLSKTWINKFLNRHQDLQSRFNQSLNKERAATHDAEKIQRWFILVKSMIQKYDI